MTDNFPTRKNIRLKDFDYSSKGAYFITICTENRKNYFWKKDFELQNYTVKVVGANCVRPQNLPLSVYGEIVLNELRVWNEAYESVRINAFVIMPNHIHILVEILGDELGRTQFAPTISRMVKQFKGAATKRIGKTIWQKSFMEHIIRDQMDYDIKLNYIYENPIRWKDDELYFEF